MIFHSASLCIVELKFRTSRFAGIMMWLSMHSISEFSLGSRQRLEGYASIEHDIAECIGIEYSYAGALLVTNTRVYDAIDC